MRWSGCGNLFFSAVMAYRRTMFMLLFGLEGRPSSLPRQGCAALLVGDENPIREDAHWRDVLAEKLLHPLLHPSPSSSQHLPVHKS